MTGNEILKVLKKNGFKVIRINGSHYIMEKGKIRFPVPVHGKKDVKIGTLKNIERVSGVKLK